MRWTVFVAQIVVLRDVLPRLIRYP